MSDLTTGARAPGESGAVQPAGGRATQAAGQAAGEVAGTAKEQARHVAGEVSTQARVVASDVRDKVTEQAHQQNDRLADGIRRMADELDQMAAGRDGSPAHTLVSRVAGGGRQVADFLAQRGPEGVLSEVQEFARRRPGAFLAAALVSGFVVGRLGKSMLSGSDGTPTNRPAGSAVPGGHGVAPAATPPGATTSPVTPATTSPTTPATGRGPASGPGLGDPTASRPAQERTMGGGPR